VAEADRIAEKVMGVPEPSIASAPSQVSRKCAAGEAEEDEKLHRNPAGKAESAYLRQAPRQATAQIAKIR
jgi:hypothetical protein